MFFVSAILRTITQVLESKASGAKPIISVVVVDSKQESVLENSAAEELDITEVFKLEEADNDPNESPIPQAGGDSFKSGRRKKVKHETSTKQDKSKEPGEISAWSEGHSEEEVVFTNSFDIVAETSESGLVENENSKERVLSVIEQDHTISCVEKSVGMVSQLDKSPGQNNLGKKIRNFQPQKCPKCEFVTKGVETLRRHVRVVHREALKCSSCDFEATSPVMLKKHKRNQHQREFICRYCNYKAKNPYHIWRHELTHSDVADYMCDKCDFRTKTPQSLKTHSLYHESPKYICDLCQYTSCNSANFSTHKKTKHGTERHKCDQCEDTFQYHRHLVRHQENHQAVKFTCNVCEKQFSRKDKLREHGRRKHEVGEEEGGTKSISCPECGKILRESKHLTRHMTSMHGGIIFNCLHCQKVFSRKDKMHAHMNYSCKLNIAK